MTSARYRRTARARTVVAWLAIALVIWLVVAQAADVVESSAPWVAAAVFVSLLALFVGEVVMNREIEAPGKSWQRVGGADF